MPKKEKKEKKIEIKGDRIATAITWVGNRRYEKGELIKGLNAKQLEAVKNSTKPVKETK